MANTFQKQVNEFLKRRGLQPTMGDKFPFFDIRKTLFGQLGQTDKFIGSENQNATILQGLQGAEKNVGVKITPDNITDMVRAGIARPRAVTHPEEFPETIRGLFRAGIDPIGGRDPTIQKDIWGAAKEGATQIDPMGIWVQEGYEQKETMATLLPKESEAGLAGTSAAGLLPTIPTGQDLASMALEQIQKGITFPLQQEAKEAQKAAIQLQAQAQKENFIRELGRRGLVPGGGTAKRGLKTIEANELAASLGIDRSFALLIAQGIETGAQQIAKEAQKGRQEAIDALETLGFAINPVTGNIEPTLAARKAVVAEERFEATEARTERRAAETQERFEVSQAAAAERAAETQARFEETQKRLIAQFLVGLEEPSITITSVGGRRVAIDKKTNMIVKDFGPTTASETDEFTKGEQRALIYEDIRGRAARRLTDIAINSADNYTNTDEFIKFRNEVITKVPTYIDDFDKAFGILLNPSDAASRGLSTLDIDPFESAKLRARLRQQK